MKDVSVDAPVVRLAVGSLRAAQSPRVSGEDPDHVRALAEHEDNLPPIIVHRQTMRVIDGMHRLRVAELCEREEIDARFFDGDEAEAFLLAVHTNIAHGLPLSLADRKAAANRILRSHPEWSDRLIAERTGLAAKTVAAARANADLPHAEAGARVGRDGRVRPVSSGEGRRLAGDLIAENPNLSLREVARMAGISPETVRDVRSRVQHGEDPVPGRATQHARHPQPNRAPITRGRPESAERPGLPAAELPDAVHQLTSDPALRLNQAGRALLQIFNANALINNRFTNIVDNVPEHCRDTVARAARECALVWRTFAAELDPDA